MASFKTGDIIRVNFLPKSSERPWAFWFGVVEDYVDRNQIWVRWFIVDEKGTSDSKQDEVSITLATPFEIAKLRKLGLI